MMRYKIGSYIKIKLIKKYCTWYHTNIMKILGYNKSDELYKTNHIFSDTNLNTIYMHFVFQDEECIKKQRKEKFKKILTDEI